MQMSDPRLGRSSFERLFSPDSRDSFLSFVGNASGVPSQRDREIQYTNQLQGAQSQGLAELGKLLEETGDPQRALTKFMQSRSGQATMASPGFADMLQKFQTMATTPKVPLGPGQGLVDATGKTIATQPTTELQNFRGMIETGKLGQDDVTIAARGAINPEAQRVKTFEVLDPERGPGVIITFPGEPNRAPIFQYGPRQAPPTTEPQPSSPGKIGMFRSMGTGAKIRGVGAAVGETIDPTSQTERSRELGAQSVEHDYFRTALQGLADSSARLGVPKSVVDAVNKLGGDRGLFSLPPTQALDRAIELHGIMSNNIANEQANLGSGTLDKPGMEKARARIQAYQGILKALPTLQEMQTEKKAILGGKVSETGLPGSIAEATKSILGSVGAAQETAGAAAKGATDIGGAAVSPMGSTARSPASGPQYTPEDIAIGVKNIGQMSEQQVLAAARSPIVMGNPELKAALLARVRALKGATKK